MFQTSLYHKDGQTFQDFIQTLLQIYEGCNPPDDNPPYRVSRKFIIFLFGLLETLGEKKSGN